METITSLEKQAEIVQNVFVRIASKHVRNNSDDGTLLKTVCKIAITDQELLYAFSEMESS